MKLLIPLLLISSTLFAQKNKGFTSIRAGAAFHASSTAFMATMAGGPMIGKGLGIGFSAGYMNVDGPLIPICLDLETTGKPGKTSVYGSLQIGYGIYSPGDAKGGLYFCPNLGIMIPVNKSHFTLSFGVPVINTSVKIAGKNVSSSVTYGCFTGGFTF